MQIGLFHRLARCLPLFAAGLACALGTHADPGGQYAVGDTLEPFTLENQHGERLGVDAFVKVILFSRDMEGGELLKEGLAAVAPGYLEERGAVYVADISAMPRLVAKMFAIPAMRDRPYSILLDRDGETTAALPDVEGRATLLFLDRLVIERIVTVDDAQAVRRELEFARDASPRIRT